MGVRGDMEQYEEGVMNDFFRDVAAIMVVLIGAAIVLGILAGIIILGMMNISNLWWAIPVGILLISLDGAAIMYFAD